MKLTTKLALYNGISKIIIIVSIGAILPLVISNVVYDHIDKRLTARADRVFKMVERGGINEIILEQDCSFESYNILKEEFVSIEPIQDNGSYGPKPDFGDEFISIDEEIFEHRVLKQAFLFDNQLYILKIGEGLSAIEELDRSIREFTFWLTIIVILLSITADTLFANILLRPFHAIINRKLKPDEHPINFVPEQIRSGTDEFEYLNKSIDDMLGRVRDAFLIEKEFIANVSHELLTPISLLRSRLENLVADPGFPEEKSIKLVDSLKTLDRMSKTIRVLLLISRIENKQYLKDEQVSIVAVCEEVLTEIEERTTEKEIEIVKQWNDPDCKILGNKSLLFTMIFNIVSNAIKYNKQAGKIILTLDHLGHDRYVLSIEDTGHGISQQHLPHIFDRFKRFEKQQGEGYGLGLPIVKTIADFHDIEIDVSSESDQGTSFNLIWTGSESV